MDLEGWSFICGCAPYTDLAFVARERDDLADRDVVATCFYLWDEQQADPNNRWTIYDQIVSWRAQGMASVKYRTGERLTVGLGTHGQYFEVEPATGIENVGVIADLDPLVRRVTAIGEEFFAAGMGRSVIRRMRRGTWIEFGPGMTSTDQDEVVGFEGIDGFSPDDIYVAGWGGEIWHWSNGVWRRIDSPTNANLNAVACDRQKDLVYLVGDNGSMVRGAVDQWDFVDTRRPENLQDVAVYEGEVLAVTDFSILRLGPAGLFPEDRFIDGDAPASCLHLLVAENGVVSMGPKDLFTFDGNIWRRIV